MLINILFLLGRTRPIPLNTPYRPYLVSELSLDRNDEISSRKKVGVTEDKTKKGKETRVVDYVTTDL